MAVTDWLQTCLGERKGGEKGGLLTPPCFSLDFAHTRILLECPIDLSALLSFLPSALPPDVDQQVSDPRSSLHHISADTLPSSSSRSSLTGKGDFRQDGLHPGKKRPRDDKSGPLDDGGPRKKSHYYRAIGGQYFIDAAPWYKTPDFNVVDATSLNVVIISNPVAMLGLPLLVRNPDFTAKIYATHATAKLGQLMMEELVALQTEFTHQYGRSMKSVVPPWVLPEFISTLPAEVREKLVGSHKAGEQWNQLYSTADIRACMARVHRLHYGEEANIDGFLTVKPSSSGFGIGSSNWVLKGPNRNLSYISASSSKNNHAMPLDIPALGGSEVLLLSHWEVGESLQDESSEAGRKVALSASEKLSTDMKAVDTTTNELHPGSGGAAAPKLSSQRMSPSTSSSVSPVPLGSTSHSSSILHKLPPHVLLQATPEKSGGKSTSEDNENTGQTSAMLQDERFQMVRKAVVDTLGNGGSVLIPMHFYGIFLELMEEIASHLRSSGLEIVPIYYISPVAEELLAYSNTVPEWLCPARQEKLYAGESLFGFLEPAQEKRIHCFPALNSADLLNFWQEPCVVFASHWSLRVGPAVHLLRRWRNNPLCLLILTEPNVDQQLLLAPFMPFTIQVLHLPVSTTLRSQDVLSTQELKPQVTVVPEIPKFVGDGSDDLKARLFSFKLWKTIKIPSTRNHNNLEVEMSADLALQIQLKQVKAGKIAAAHLKADLQVRDGHWSLDVASPATFFKGLPFHSLPRYQIRWGKVNVDSLLTGLRERGLYDLQVTEGTGLEDSEGMETSDGKVVTIEIKTPSRARIEISSSKINVHANEPSLRRLIVEVVNSALSVL
ncbi:unnamed protein product [Calypogeia fissa]